MPVGTMIFMGIMLAVFVALDLIMLISLLKPGDERNQVIVWKASSLTLCAIVGSTILDIVENFLRAQPMMINPFVQLEVMAIIYFIALMYYRKKHGA